MIGKAIKNSVRIVMRRVSFGYSEIRSGDEDSQGVGKFEMEELVLP